MTTKSAPDVSGIVIRPLDAGNRSDLDRCDNSFTVEAELYPAAEDGRITTTVRPATPYVKYYGPEAHTRKPTSTGPITPPGWPTRTAGSPGRSSCTSTGTAWPSSGTSPWPRPSAAGAWAAA